MTYVIKVEIVEPWYHTVTHLFLRFMDNIMPIYRSEFVI